MGFVDGVMRPEDLGVAGRNLAEVAKLTPKFLPAYLKGAIRLGGAMAPAFFFFAYRVADYAAISLNSATVESALSR